MEIDFIVVKQGNNCQVQQWIKGERIGHDFDHWVKAAICTMGKLLHYIRENLKRGGEIDLILKAGIAADHKRRNFNFYKIIIN